MPNVLEIVLCQLLSWDPWLERNEVSHFGEQVHCHPNTAAASWLWHLSNLVHGDIVRCVVWYYEILYPSIFLISGCLVLLARVIALDILICIVIHPWPVEQCLYELRGPELPTVSGNLRVVAGFEEFSFQCRSIQDVRSWLLFDLVVLDEQMLIKGKVLDFNFCPMFCKVWSREAASVNFFRRIGIKL